MLFLPIQKCTEAHGLSQQTASCPQSQRSLAQTSCLCNAWFVPPAWHTPGHPAVHLGAQRRQVQGILLLGSSRFEREACWKPVKTKRQDWNWQKLAKVRIGINVPGFCGNKEAVPRNRNNHDKHILSFRDTGSWIIPRYIPPGLCLGVFDFRGRGSWKWLATSLTLCASSRCHHQYITRKARNLGSHNFYEVYCRCCRSIQNPRSSLEPPGWR